MKIQKIVSLIVCVFIISCTGSTSNATNIKENNPEEALITKQLAILEHFISLGNFQVEAIRQDYVSVEKIINAIYKHTYNKEDKEKFINCTFISWGFLGEDTTLAQAISFVNQAGVDSQYCKTVIQDFNGVIKYIQALNKK